ncbi:hypothetical protein HY546_00315 [archaeon]|nr:hypothetical protein [archaeon]
MNGDTGNAGTRTETQVMGSATGSLVPVADAPDGMLERNRQLIERARKLRELNSRLAADNEALRHQVTEFESDKTINGGRLASLEMTLQTATQAAEKAEERARDAQLQADVRVAEVQRATGETIAEAVKSIEADAAAKIAKITKEAEAAIIRWRDLCLQLQNALGKVLDEESEDSSDGQGGVS